MIVLDASAMIAILDSDDTHHPLALEMFRSHGGRFAAHRLTLAETLVSAVRANQGPTVQTALADLGVDVIDDQDDPLSLAELRVRTGLRMPDVCVLHSAIRARARMATFDTRLASAARALGVIVVP
ncbi:type II toxin-antitoxin system VapC family toxin [Microbacterium sp. NPDC055903]